MAKRRNYERFSVYLPEGTLARDIVEQHMANDATRKHFMKDVRNALVDYFGKDANWKETACRNQLRRVIHDVAEAELKLRQLQKNFILTFDKDPVAVKQWVEKQKEIFTDDIVEKQIKAEKRAEQNALNKALDARNNADAEAMDVLNNL